MKQIFGWLKSKMSGGKSSTPSTCETTQQEPNKQAISDLLTIGTLGDKTLNKSHHHHENLPPSSSSPPPSPSSLAQDGNYQNLTPEEIQKLQQLIELLGKQDLPDSNKLQVIRNSSDYCIDVTKKATLQKKLSSFLLKKVFACRSRFSPVPPLRTPSESLEPRMGKVLRAILNKKIYPHQSSCSQPLSPRRLIGDSPMVKLQSEDDDNASKWDKTDSEYIVLEI